jgi:hypothetical protein
MVRRYKPVWQTGTEVRETAEPRGGEASETLEYNSYQEAVRRLNEYLSNELRLVRAPGALRNRILSLISKPDGVEAATPPGTEAILSNEA